ncbi:uncharacterized protein LOC131046772 [Cryptomeria japonica]|uniref:uncharacterized protein LOC131046772 n=1 Tax=Cryptomeria japonica TaxID=3369 RepID=UPI0025AC62D0|nr:uncharacterized protein LOC131046772 [Cryptomeria japonica]
MIYTKIDLTLRRRQEKTEIKSLNSDRKNGSKPNRDRLDRCREISDEKVVRRLDEDLSRFEMIYPSKYEIRPRILETRINEQDDQIAYLEEEGTSLRERVNNMEQGIDSLKLRMRVLEVANAFKSTEILSGEASFA